MSKEKRKVKPEFIAPSIYTNASVPAFDVLAVLDSCEPVFGDFQF
jgi:hypothetical protein